MVCAGDVVLLAWGKRKLKEITKKLIGVAKNMDLESSEKETQFMDLKKGKPFKFIIWTGSI